MSNIRHSKEANIGPKIDRIFLHASSHDVVEDLPRSGLPLASSTEVNMAKVKEMVTENRYLSLKVPSCNENSNWQTAHF